MSDQTPGTSRQDPIDRLRSVWANAEEPPSIAPFLDDACTREQVLDAVRFDALERARRGLESGPEFYLGLLTPEHFDLAAAFLVNRELAAARLKGGTEAESHVRDRLRRTFPEYLGRAEESSPSEFVDPRARTEDLDPYLHEGDPQYVEYVPGSTIGPYKIIRKLGEGGFGVVYLAERRDPTQRVALKVLRPNRVNDAAIRRFKAEREALARLDHPGIARILSTGLTQDGRPYFAMQYVQGEWITTYCDRQRLPLKDRLKLFAQVCDAVHHAHLSGIIHRDLSPDNILVTVHGKDTPQPVVIDFGIARAVNPNVRLSEQTLSAPFGELIGKREYMAPEQAEAGQAGIDGRTDIYALGVILYELLVGVRPLDRDKLLRDFDDMIRFADRPDPSTRLKSLTADEAMTAAYARQCASGIELTRLLAGRVRHLPMKALVPDRTQRFSSASMMAADVRNYLEDKDFVEAAAEPKWSVILRFTRRNKGPAIAAACVFATLLLGVIGTSIGYVVAERRREEASLARLESEAVQETFFRGLIGSADPYLDASQVRLADQIEQFGERLLSDEPISDQPLPPVVRGRLCLITGTALERLGLPDSAAKLLDEARDRLGGSADAREDDHLAGVDLLWALYRNGQYEEVLSRSPKVFNELSASPSSDKTTEQTFSARLCVAAAKRKLGRLDESARLCTVLRAEIVGSGSLDDKVRGQLRLDAEHDLQLIRMAREQAMDSAFAEGDERLSPAIYDDIAREFDHIADEKAAAPGTSEMWVLESRYEAAKARFRAAKRVPENRPERESCFRTVATELDELRNKMRVASGGKHWRYIELVDTAGATNEQLGSYAKALRYNLENYELNVEHFGRDDQESLTSMRWLIGTMRNLGFKGAAAWFAEDGLRRAQELDPNAPGREDLLDVYTKLVEELKVESNESVSP